MSQVMYDGNRLIPAPLVTITKQYQTTTDGEKVGSLFQISVAGTMLAFKGSPSSSGTFWTTTGYPADETVVADSRLAAIIRKQEAIRELFDTDGKQFEVQSADGSQPMKCNPRVVSIEFPQDIWYNTSVYNIVLEADELSVNGVAQGEDNFSAKISSASETWVIDTQEDQPEGLGASRTYRLSHTVSAQGKRFYDSAGNLVKPAWQQARDFVLPKLGFDSTIALSSGVNNLPTYYQGVNHARSENVGELDGSYSITETWIMSSGTAIEDFTVDTRESADDGLIRVGINGTIRGLEQRDSDLQLTTSAYDNALTKFAEASGLALHRAQTYSGHTLNIQQAGSTVGRNPVAGTINYSFEYNDRPSNLIAGAKSEVISINDSFGADQFASIFVLGRSAGPVLQSLSTKQATTRSLNIEVVFGAGYVGNGDATSRIVTKHPRNNPTILATISGIINAAEPVQAGIINNAGNAATTSLQSTQNENWDITTGRYTYSAEWTYE